MRRARHISERKSEQGIVILIVAVVLLFVVGAMAALSIDVVTVYTARSEAQLAADGAALAGARVLASSGMTSDPNAATDGLRDSTRALGETIASRVAMSNEVGGRALTAGEVNVSWPNLGDTSFLTNPRITVRITRNDLPTFFARIWGKTTVPVQATATAETYNPSGANALGGPVIPVAPTCVKPWVLPNLNPIDGTSQIVDPTTGSINNSPGILVNTDISGTLLESVCSRGTGPTGCNTSTWFPGTVAAWKFYPGAQSSFAAPTVFPSCTGGSSYEQSVAGCVQAPIACGSTVNLESGPLGTGFTRQTADAVNCLTHATSNASDADSVDLASRPPSGPYQFLAGTNNPLVQAGTLASSTDITVSDSIVTVPIFDQSSLPTTTATVIGFVQLFLNSDGNETNSNGANSGRIKTEVINVVGCKNGANPPYILGNGSSPVAVRLITSP